MKVKAWPTGIAPASVDIGLQQDVQVTRSRSGKHSSFEMPGASWVMTLTFPNSAEWLSRPKVEALITSLRGGANRLSAPHFGRPIPNGTLRGAPRLDAAVQPGAGQLRLKDCNGALRAGDFIGLGGQLLMIEEDAAPTAGKMTVSVNPAVRVTSAINSPVIWDRPHILWILRDKEGVKFPYRPGRMRPSFAIELVEDWV
ncbi:hypothetical protein [Alcaligenes endophyticus]|uniref:Uncharacterized protein n=1 Tax=Alcaligenes endophyticus TaxID=1929088 RepID=A0ABT8ENH3_9BURK|nr:hypothetical protein [Alcaligenes endophyticus]MCX5592793.1 hypothetical protein [Alcaligenes endophyticus]MDN4122835.1 hypothetical protein [Alcaligenes endophyticus]